MLKLAGVNGRDFLIDLGSGDGRIPITAAKRFGTRGYGVDYVGTLVKLANDNAAKAGVADRVRFEERDIFKTDVSAATVVAFYLLPDFNLELRPKLLEELKPGTRLVSHDGDMGDWPPDAKIVVDAPGKTVGVEKKSTIYLWVVPAMVMGEWKTRVPLAGRNARGHARPRAELPVAVGRGERAREEHSARAGVRAGAVRVLPLSLRRGRRAVRGAGDEGSDRREGYDAGREHASLAGASRWPALNTTDRVAVVVVHGIADQRPGQTVVEVVRLLCHSEGDASRYVRGEMHDVLVPVEKLEPGRGHPQDRLPLPPRGGRGPKVGNDTAVAGDAERFLSDAPARVGGRRCRKHGFAESGITARAEAG